MKLLIKDGLIFNSDNEPQKKDILINKGLIAQVSDNINIDTADIIDAKGNYVVPGFIDLSCEVCEPGFEYRETIRSVTKGAAKGGFTTITCHPNTEPLIDNKTMVNYMIEKGKKQSLINILPYGCMTKRNEGKEISEIGEMVSAGIVAVSDGGSSIQDARLMRNILSYARMFKIPIITYCEDSTLAGNGVINKGNMSIKLGLQGITRDAEDIIVARNILLSRETNRRLHITRISTKGTVQLVRYAKESGMVVTCDTCPHYFTLTEDAVKGYNTLAKVRPPLRTKEDMESIIEGLIDGTIDAISSGHSPQTKESKDLEFDRATYGISSLETTFSISYSALVETKLMPLSALIQKLSAAPAKILNLNNKGKILESYDADLIIIAKEGSYTINASDFASKAKFSPYNGKTVNGIVLYTIVNGRIAHSAEEQLTKKRSE